MDLKEFRESTDRNLIWKLQSGEVTNLLNEAIGIIENYENQVSCVGLSVKPACVQCCKNCCCYDVENSVEKNDKKQYDVCNKYGFNIRWDIEKIGCTDFESESV